METLDNEKVEAILNYKLFEFYVQFLNRIRANSFHIGNYN